METDAWKDLLEGLKQLDSSQQLELLDDSAGSSLRTVATALAPTMRKLDSLPAMDIETDAMMVLFYKNFVKDSFRTCLEAELKHAMKLCEAQEVTHGQKFSALAGEKDPFLPSLEVDGLLREVLAHELNVDAHEKCIGLALVLGFDDVVIIVTAAKKMDACRKSVARAALDALQHVSSIKVSAGDPEVEEMVWNEDSAQSLVDAKGSLETLSCYLCMERPFEMPRIQREGLQEWKRLHDDGAAMLRVIDGKVRSQWLASLQRLRQNVQACFPENWRQFTVRNRDDELILEHLVNNAVGAKLFARRGALDQAFTKIMDSYDMLSATTVQGGPPEQKMPQREIECTRTMLEEAKLVVGVRAAVTVALVKVAACKTAKSRAATIREVKRLIAALEIDHFPSAVMTILDESGQ